ncbi:T9SS-dependent M36 family metallopeptidase, partial [Crocinitomicaceae bacterium]|nr:T9SS-dependent M36 family metallopeptidase [Crocinitomicaceae bacterium]
CAIGLVSYAQTTQERIKTYFEREHVHIGLTQEDFSDFEIKNEHSSKQFDISYAYAHQRYEGIIIYNAIANFAFNDNEMRLTGNRFISDIDSRVNTTNATISKRDAIYNAAVELGINVSTAVDIDKTKDANGNNVFVASEISSELIPVSLCYTLDGEDLKLAWDLSILHGNDWWSVRVDATTGSIINQVNWMVSCSFGSTGSCEDHVHPVAPEVEEQMLMPAPPPNTDAYRVLAIPIESPNHGPDALVIGPYDAVASPFGWHDIDGNAGEEFTITRGNNVYASEDTDDDNQPGYSPDGGAALNFDFSWNLNQPAVGFWDPAITNLFYMNNIMHDVFYHYGFDEVGGNFQENNYGNGGSASDNVNADAQDGSGTNNANFGTPPDGQNPRMQMYIWTAGGTPQIVEIFTPAVIAGTYNGQEATFGPGLPVTPIVGDFVLVDDGTGDTADACEPIQNGAAINGNIAVIRRGSCSFVDKVVAAEAEGATAVIIVNNTGGLTPPGGTDPGIGIPTIMVTALDGENIIDEIELGNTVNGQLGDFGPWDRDSDLDNGVIAHEYGHGISNRLTGGPSAAGCLGNAEQMGEGWSDWCALITTIEPGDQGSDARGIGTYSDGQPTSGVGIRPAPYSTDIQVNSFTYGSTNNTAGISQPHGIGFVWCTMLWDLTWALIDQYGFDNDIYQGTGGNNIAMHLITNGMKMQACSPGFIDGRDGILAADQMLYNGAHQCLIWEVFANRGLGFSADQGDNDERDDQIAAFDLPPGIDHITDATVSCSDYVWAVNGQTYTATGTYFAPITPSIGCDSVATLNLTVNSTINAIITYDGPTVLECLVDNVNYQWIDCSNGDTAIVGATSQAFAPTQNGLYAVIASQGNCTDTSVCFLVNQLQAGLGELNITDQILVSPNPTNGDIFVNLGGALYSNIDASVLNAMGQVVAEGTFENTSEFDMSIDTAPGVYFVNVIADGKTGIIKIIKE